MMHDGPQLEGTLYDVLGTPVIRPRCTMVNAFLSRTSARPNQRSIREIVSSPVSLGLKGRGQSHLPEFPVRLGLFWSESVECPHSCHHLSSRIVTASFTRVNLVFLSSCRTLHVNFWHRCIVARGRAHNYTVANAS